MEKIQATFLGNRNLRQEMALQMSGSENKSATTIEPREA
jgi:hypothetical protein